MDSGRTRGRLTPAQLKLRRWRESPATQVKELYGIDPDPWQLELLNVFPTMEPDKIRISLQACVGPGKTAALAWCGWNFLSCYGSKGEHPKGAAVSVTGDNLADNLWPEMSKWQSRSEFLMKAFTWTKSRIFAVDHPETWFLSARSWAKNSNAEEQGRTLSGLHSKFVLVLIDESGDIPVAILKAADQAMGNCIFGKIIQAGNPTSHHGMLYAAATKLRHLWYIIRITGDPDSPMRSPRIDLAWAKEQIETYGRFDPWVMSSILGEFPPSSIDSLLGPDEIAAAMSRTVDLEKYEFVQKRLGVDVARFGNDKTVIFPRQGLRAFRPVIMRGARTTEVAARVVLAREKWKSEMEFIDDTGGYGGGVIDSMVEGGYSPIPVNFSGKAYDPRYLNKRAEMWFRMAKWIKSGGALPNMPELARELTAPTYTFQGGKLKLEEKAHIKKRIQISPDISDALALTFAEVDMPASKESIYGVEFKEDNLKSEFDPFAEKTE